MIAPVPTGCIIYICMYMCGRGGRQHVPAGSSFPLFILRERPSEVLHCKISSRLRINQSGVYRIRPPLGPKTEATTKTLS